MFDLNALDEFEQGLERLTGPVLSARSFEALQLRREKLAAISQVIRRNSAKAIGLRRSFSTPADSEVLS